MKKSIMKKIVINKRLKIRMNRLNKLKEISAPEELIENEINMINELQKERDEN